MKILLFSCYCNNLLKTKSHHPIPADSGIARDKNTSTIKPIKYVTAAGAKTKYYNCIRIIIKQRV